MGGDELSTTRGVVNRITLGGTTRELCLQIDATFNPGNSGGPVLGPNGSLIGMSASNFTQAQNAGYIIPMPARPSARAARPSPPLPTPLDPSHAPRKAQDPRQSTACSECLSCQCWQTAW